MATIEQPKSIIITGGSSGIGQALAEAYAAPGITLFLTGRDQARLSEVAQRCEQKGADVRTASPDITDSEEMRTLILGWHDVRPIDLVIANAGTSGGVGRGNPVDVVSDEVVRTIFSVNINGVLNTVLPMVEPMVTRGRGQVAIMSSLAGFRGMPTAPAYCASKAAVRSWGEGLRGRLAPHGVSVSVICPGFVVSRITDANTFKMPMLMPADRAATIIIRGLQRNRGRIAFPWPMFLGAWLLNMLPVSWSDRVVGRLPDKG